MSLEDKIEALAIEVRALRADFTKPKLIKVAAFAAAHSISKSTVRALIKSGRLPVTKVGAVWLVAADAAIGTTSTSRAELTPADRVARIVRGAR